MSAVKNNPYRTLGLFANSSEKDLQKQISTITRFAEVGKTKCFDCDFPVLGEFIRTPEIVHDAATKIEQSKNKVHYSLFWFLNLNHIDEAALSHLKEGNIDKATEIWGKIIKDNSILPTNYSAVLNLSTLQLGLTTKNGSFSLKEFKSCIERKGQLIASDSYFTFVQSVAGENITVTREIILKEFLDEILQIIKPYFNKSKGISTAQLIEIFSTYPIELKQYLASKFTDQPISNIENKLEKTKENRNNNPSAAKSYGEELYNKTKDDFASLRNILGSNNVLVQVLANKLANEILQCSIDFFNKLLKKEGYDPGDDALKLAKAAREFAPTGQVKTRLEENIENIQEWIDNKDERNNRKLIELDIAYIVDQIDSLDDADEPDPLQRLIRTQLLFDTGGIDSSDLKKADNFLTNCLPKLSNIRSVIGGGDETYLQISSAVINNCLNLIIDVVNRAQKGLSSSLYDYDRYNKITKFTGVVQISIELIQIMLDINTHQDTKARLRTNKETIWSIGRQLNVSFISRKDKLIQEIQTEATQLKDMQNKTFLAVELRDANDLMRNIKSWHLFRSSEDREKQIAEQQIKLNQIQKRSEEEKVKQIKSQQVKVANLKLKLKQLE